MSDPKSEREWRKRAEAAEAALRSIRSATDDLKKDNGYWGSACGVCSGHSPSWDGHSRNCERAYPDRVRAILDEASDRG